MSISTKQVVSLGTVILGAMLLSGCGPTDYAEKKAGEKIIEKAIESQTGGTVDVNSSKDEMTIKSQEGEFSMSGSGNATLHKDFPKDIYVAPDAKIMLSMANGENKSYSAAYFTSLKTDEVNAKYREELAKNGWLADPQTEIVFDDSRTILYKKGTQRLTLIVGLSKDKENAGKTYVQVIGAEDTQGGS